MQARAFIQTAANTRVKAGWPQFGIVSMGRFE